MTEKIENLPKINPTLEHIVAGFIQCDIGDVELRTYRRGLLYSESEKNKYSVKENGELAEILIFDNPKVNFEEILKCRELQAITIARCGISEIPPELGSLHSIKKLNLSGNKIKEIPAAISRLEKLESLELSSNLIEKTPDHLENLTKLEHLDLSHNNIKEIPKSITRLTNLKSLLLSGNQIDSIPSHIKSLINLNNLSIHGNKIESIENLRIENIKSLNLSKNSISKIPDNLFLMKEIIMLNFDDNKIQEIPTGFSRLKKLSSLFISENNLKEIPEEIFNIKTILHLGIKKNSIFSIPKSIGKLINLEYLDASENKLSTLPAELLELEKLNFLDLSQNKLESLPEVRKSLSNNKLNFLRLKDNNLKSIPNYFSNFNYLHVISLQGNPLPIPDPCFHDLTPSEQIQSLLFIQRTPLRPLKQAKILVVGDERVGKTSVINRLLGKPHNENQTSTQGIDISELSIGQFQVNIWDFAGQELTHQTHQFFLTERSLYLYVLDAQKEDNQARDLHWLSTIKSYSEDSPIIVVVNHCDQNINYTFDIERYQEEFNIVKVVYTSACNLNKLNNDIKAILGDSISKLSDAIKDKIPNLPGIERELPLSWHNVKSSLEELKKTSNVIEKDFFEKECEKAGIVAKPLQDALLKVLNSIGTVVAYPNDFRLRLTQILKPQWVTNAVYKIIRSPSGTQGVYSEAVVSQILCNEYTHSHQQWLIDLLIKFELGFRLPENQDLLIPMKLQTAMPAYDKTKYQRGLNIRFNYHRRGLLKQNVMPQLIVRMHNYIDENTSKYWRHGMFIRLNDCQGVIISDEPNQCIDVYLSHRNDDSRTLLSWIRSNLARIELAHTKASKDGALPYVEQIALFDDSYSHVIGHADYLRIERANKQNKHTISLEIKDPLTGDLDDKDYNVAELLGLYKFNDSRIFKANQFINFLKDTLLRLTETRLRIIGETEDDTNDRLRESLRAGGYLIADQSRGGLSGSTKSTGERDLVVLNEFGQQACIIEALILNGFDKTVIQQHYLKLSTNYNTHGNPIDFLISYGKVKSIDKLWKSYRSVFPDIEDITRSYTDKASLRLGLTYVEDQDSQTRRKIIHMLINFGTSN
ncbi:MAG: leucine-rich repeat domain-containing protein [Chromatiaceae bacterium]|nr:leucine-rich repeat domain-containing protein [Chromatiaceae bacterium]